MNPAAIDLLEVNQDKINWCGLSININPRALQMLNANQDIIN